jgi:hemoglobin/transferrin/lactoferrin receptor protein
LSVLALAVAAPGVTNAQSTSAQSQALPELSVEASAPAKKKSTATKKKPSAAPVQSEANAEPAASQATAEGPGGGPLATGADVTITSGDLALTQPQNVQQLFSGQSAVQAGGTTQASTKVYVHGIEETNLNVQIDGARQPQRNGFHHNGNNLIDPSMLKGVAVDAGAASADAGPHALGGAIRYTTKDVSDLLQPGRKLGGFASLTYDTNSNTFKKSGSAYGKSHGFEILGYASGADGDAYEDGHGNEVVATDVDLVNYLGKVALESDTGHRFAVSGEYVKDEGIRPFRANFALIPGFAIPYSFNESERETYTFKYTSTRPNDVYDPEISAYYNKNTLFRPPTGTCAVGQISGPCVAFGNVEIESKGGKVQNTFVVGPGKLTAGVDYYEDKSTVDHLGANPLIGERLSNVGAYAQYRFSPVDPLRISLGLRGDVNRFDASDGSEHDHSALSPNVSAELDLTRQITAKASYGYSFGGTPLYEAFLLRNPSNPVYGSDLDPQRGETYKAGLQFKEGGFIAEATYFNTHIYDPVCPNCTPVINQDQIETRGVDISARYSLGYAQLAVNYTHTDTTFGNGPLTTTSWYYGTPFGDLLKISGHYEFRGTGVIVGFLSDIAFEYDELEFVTGAPGGTYGVLDGYDVHNVYAQWIPNFASNVTLRADVLNIFDTYYVDRATAVGGTIVPLASPGRTVLLSGKVEF